jgi:chaperone modulatory protein CbpM
VSYALVRVPAIGGRRMDLAAFARAAGVHPDLVRRLVVLGLLEPDRDTAGALWFSPAELARIARMQRLRAAFSVNYAALGLVMELLERIAELESALHAGQRTASRSDGGNSWT